MNEFKVKIINTKNVTHDVKSIQVEKPAEYKFTPGQATDVSINKAGYIDQKRSFTFTSLNEWTYLEFIIKIYNNHDGVTKEIGRLNEGDELIIGEPWGTISYKGEGTFIAGGAGITPFIAILRDLQSKGKIGNNKLIFANKTKSDIILKEEFEKMLGDNFINILSDERTDEYPFGLITEEFLKSNIDDLSTIFYLCGPPQMMESVEKILTDFNISKSNIVKEEF